MSVLNLSNLQEKFNLEDKPTLKKIGRLTIQQKCEFIAAFGKTYKGYDFYIPPLELKKYNNTREFLEFIRSRYKTEKGEIFSHPRRFYEFGGDCDCQSLYFLCHQKYLNEQYKGKTYLLILKRKNFTHITQSVEGKIIDFLPYEIPTDSKCIYYYRV